MKTIVALYDDFAAAQRATQELAANGFDRGNISLVANDVAGEYSQYINDPNAPSDTLTANSTAAGAGTGAVIGGIGGLLVGLGALAIPGIGPIIAAGPLVSALVGAGIGAMAGGLVGALTSLGVPETEAGYYAEGVRRGGALVTAQVSDDQVDRAMDILDQHNPVDIEERANRWREKGWSGFDPNAESYTVDSLKQERATYTGYGEAGLTPTHSRGWAEVEPPADEPSLDPEADPNYGSRGWVEVEPPADEVNYAGGQTSTATTTWNDSADTANFDDDNYLDDEYSSYETHYRQHYSSNYTSSGYPYEQYAPAYRYGYDLAVHPGYSNYSWAEVEPAARISWEETNQGTWDHFKDAVRHAWEEVKEAVDLDDDDDFDTVKDLDRAHASHR